jgi:SAM-dependent methyltransferase
MQDILDASYDFVYSSHCLEHMSDVHETLINWVRILRPGGILYLAVPDFILYEKGIWPSQFNPDHKATFSFYQFRETRANHYVIEDLRRWFEDKLGISIIEVRLENDGFDLARFGEDQTEEDGGWAQSQICLIGCKKRQENSNDLRGDACRQRSLQDGGKGVAEDRPSSAGARDLDPGAKAQDPQ